MTNEQYRVHNDKITSSSRSVRHALEALECAALEPITDLEVMLYAGALAQRTGEFVNLCMVALAEKLAEKLAVPGEEVNR